MSEPLAPSAPPRPRYPDWIRVRAPYGENYGRLRGHLPRVEYVHSHQFAKYREAGMKPGFKHVASGPLVRSSYKAWEAALA